MKLTDKNIHSTHGEDDPVFNGIYIETGCECDGYGCKDVSFGCDYKKLELKKQILDNQEKLEKIKELKDSITTVNDEIISEFFKDLEEILSN